MLLDHQRISRQLFHIGVAQRIAVAQLGGHIRGLDQFAASGLLLRSSELHLNQFGTQAAPNHGAFAGLEHRLVHIKFVRVDRALHHGLAEPVARGDEHHLVKTGLGIDGEHDAGRAQVGAHHALNTRTQSDMLMGKTLVHPVADGAVVV